MYNISADTHEVQQDWMTAINTSLALIKSLPVSAVAGDHHMTMSLFSPLQQFDTSRSRVTSVTSNRTSSGAGLLKRRSARKDNARTSPDRCVGYVM